jgi:hypothetical protein
MKLRLDRNLGASDRRVKNPRPLPIPVLETPRPHRDAARPAGPTPPAGDRPSLPEPPPYRAHPLAPAGGCVNCGSSIRSNYAVPRCWECGRPLCVDCYWHHGLAPADHRCAACAGRVASPKPDRALARSGAKAAAPASPSAGASRR